MFLISSFIPIPLIDCLPFHVLNMYVSIPSHAMVYNLLPGSAMAFPTSIGWRSCAGFDGQGELIFVTLIYPKNPNIP